MEMAGNTGGQARTRQKRLLRFVQQCSHAAGQVAIPNSLRFDLRHFHRHVRACQLANDLAGVGELNRF